MDTKEIAQIMEQLAERVASAYRSLRIEGAESEAGLVMDFLRDITEGREIRYCDECDDLMRFEGRECQGCADGERAFRAMVEMVRGIE